MNPNVKKAPQNSTESDSTVAPREIGSIVQDTKDYAIHVPQGPQTKRYMKIRCPSEMCQHEMVLTCPYCQKGALRTSGQSFLLVCDCCHNSLRAVACDCGFEIRSSFIHEKQNRLEILEKAADKGAFSAIVQLFLLAGALGLLIALIGG